MAPNHFEELGKMISFLEKFQFYSLTKKNKKKKKQLHTVADISLVSAAAQLYGDMPKR